MTAVNNFASEWFWSLAASAWQTAVLAIIIAVVLFISRRRVSSQFRYALLLLVLLKFAVPPFLTSSAGFFSNASQFVVSSVVTNVEITPVVVAETVVATDASLSTEAAADQIGFSSKAIGAPSDANRAMPVDRAAGTAGAFSWITFATILYGFGAFVFLVKLTRQYARLRKIVSGAETTNPIAIVRDINDICSQLRMRRIPRILLSQNTDAPFATGFLRPVIVLPHDLAKRLDPDQLRIVIAHELAHIRRKDLLVGWLEAMLGIVWWFHPAMWWLKRSLRQTREDCCDDLLVIQQLAEPDRYCETLIRAATFQTFRVAEPVALGFSDGEHPAAQRIRRLMDASLLRSARLRKTTLVATLLLACVLLPGMQPISAPVTKTTLVGGLFGGWRNLPFTLSEEEEAAVRECREIAQLYFHTRNNQRLFDEPDTRVRLEGMLQQHPKLFYAQHLLATWYRINGDELKSAELFEQALKNAPVVLTRKYKEGTNVPIARVAIHQQSLECNRVQNGSLDPSLELKYVGLMTDAEGVVQIPAYDTVFRISGNYPDDYSCDIMSLGWFESKARIGVLPDAVAWQPYSKPRGYQLSASDSSRLSVAKGTVTNEIEVGPIKFALGSVSRAQRDGTFSIEDGRSLARTNAVRELPTIRNAEFMDHAFIDIAAPTSDRFDVSDAVVLDSQTKIDLREFQSGAGIGPFERHRFHVYSLWDSLPDSLDLLLHVHSYPDNALRSKISPEVGAVAQHGDVTFRIKHLIAGHHQGWSSSTGFYGEPQEIRTSSEIIFDLTGNNEHKVSLWIVAKDQRRLLLKPGGWHVPNMMEGPSQIGIPLHEIDHFELLPYVQAEAIYFENLQLPARRDPVDNESPAIAFPVDGVPQSFVSNVLSPLKIRFESLPGNAYSGIGGRSHGITLIEQDPKRLDAENSSTVSWIIDGSAVFNQETEYIMRLEDSQPDNMGRRSSMNSWSKQMSGGVDSRRVPLPAVQGVRLFLFPKAVGD